MTILPWGVWQYRYEKLISDDFWIRHCSIINKTKSIEINKLDCHKLEWRQISMTLYMYWLLLLSVWYDMTTQTCCMGKI